MSLIQNGSMNFTVYKSAMCQETGTYYYTDYYNRRINAIKLNNADLDGKEITSFSVIITNRIYFSKTR